MPVCPQCGSALEYRKMFGRYHCNRCIKYVVDMKDGLALAGIFQCPYCGKDLFYVKEYERDFCFGCRIYAPEGFRRPGRVR